MPSKEEFRLGRNYCLAVEDQGEALRFAKRLLATHPQSRCLMVTSSHPRKLHEDYGMQDVDVIWVTDEPSKEIKSIQPGRMKFELTKDLLFFVQTHENGVVFIEGIEYLMLVNGFDGVLAFVKQIADKTAARGHTLLVSINSRSIQEQQYIVFKGRFDRAGEARSFRLPGEDESDVPLIPMPLFRSAGGTGGDAGAPAGDPGGSPPPPAAHSSPTSSPSTPAGREPTGVDGLDEVIEGGFPHGSSVLLQAPPGVERDMFAAQFACEGLRRGQHVAITVSMISVADLRERLRSIGLDPDAHENDGTLRIIDWFSHKNERILGIEEKGSVYRVSRGLTNLEIALSKVTRAFAGKPTRLVIDVLTPAITSQGFESANKFAEVVRAKLSKAGITALFIVDKSTHDQGQLSSLQQVFDGVIDVEREKVGTKVGRKIAVLTMKGSYFESEYLELGVARGRGLFLIGAEPASAQGLPATTAVVAPIVARVVALPSQSPRREPPAPRKIELDEAPAAPVPEPVGEDEVDEIPDETDRDISPPSDTRLPPAPTSGASVSVPRLGTRPIARPRSAKKRSRAGLLAGMMIAVMTIAGLAGLVLFGPKAPGDPIDGTLEEWGGVTFYREPAGPGTAGADVTGYAVRESANVYYFAVETRGPILSPSKDTQVITIFIDTDGDQYTGYQHRSRGAESSVTIVGWEGKVESAFASRFTSTDTWDINGFEKETAIKAASSGNVVEIAVSDDAIKVRNPAAARWYVGAISVDGSDESLADVGFAGAPLLAVRQEPASSPDSISATTDALRVRSVALGGAVTVSDFGLSSDGAIPNAPSNIAVAAGQEHVFVAQVDPAGLADAVPVTVSINDATHVNAGNSTIVTLRGAGFSTYVNVTPTSIVIDGAFGDWTNETRSEGDPADAADKDVDLREVKASDNIMSAIAFYASVEGLALAGGLPLLAPLRPSGGGGGGGGGTKLPRLAGVDILRIFVNADEDTLSGNMTGGSGSEYLVEVGGFGGHAWSGSLFGWDGSSWNWLVSTEQQSRAGAVEVSAPDGLLSLSPNWTAYFEMTSWSGVSDEGPVVAAKEMFAALKALDAPTFAWETSTAWQTARNGRNEVKASAIGDVDLDGELEIVTAGQYYEEATPTPRYGYGMAYDTTRNVVWIHGGASYAALLSDTWKFDPMTHTWTRANTAGAFGRSHGAMVYLPTVDRLAFFGGCTTTGCSGGLRNETFIMDPATLTWTQLPAGPAPTPRWEFEFSLHGSTGEGLFFGGCAATTCMLGNLRNDTWTFDGTQWTNQSLAMVPPVAPTRRSHSEMAYADTSATTILYSGTDFATYIQDTWSYDRALNRWTKLSPPGGLPTATEGHTMTYDSAARRVLMFGGGSGAATWEFNPVANAGQGQWKDLAPAGSPWQLMDARMVYAAASDQTIIFAGFNSAPGAVDPRTWVYSYPPNFWQEVALPQHPPPRIWDSVVYDSASGQVVVHGGVFYGRRGDTWEFDPARGRWERSYMAPSGSSPLQIYAHASAYDSKRQRTMIFGGLPSTGAGNELWRYDALNNSWSNQFNTVKPTARAFSAMAYDPVWDRLVMFGASAVGISQQTWSFDFSTNNWSQHSPGVSPPGRYAHGMVYSPVLRRVILFGGYNDSTGNLGDQWSYDPAANTWANMAPTTPPPARSFFGMAAHPIDGRAWIYGSSSVADDLYEYAPSTNAWRRVFSRDMPGGIGQTGMAYDAGSGRLIVAGGSAPGTIYSDAVWAYDFITNNWTRISAIPKAEVKIFSKFAGSLQEERAIRWHASAGSTLADVAIADIDSDGRPEIMTVGEGQMDDGYRYGEFTVLSADPSQSDRILREAYDLESYSPQNDTKFSGLTIMDVGPNGVLDAVAVGTASFWNAGVPTEIGWVNSWTWSGGTLTPQSHAAWLSDTSNDAGAEGVAAGDIDGDGVVEVVVAGHQRNSGDSADLWALDSSTVPMTIETSTSWNDNPLPAFADRTDIAVDSSGNIHVVAQGGGVDLDLYYGRYDGTRWRWEAVVTGANDSGKEAAVAVSGNGTVHVSFWDDTANEVRYARRWPGETPGWNIYRVFATHNTIALTDIAVDTAGTAHLAFAGVVGGFPRIFHARWVGSGGVACISSALSCAALDATVMIHTGVGIATFGSQVHVTYYDNTNLDLRYIKSVDSGSAWGAPETVDSAVASSIGWQPHMVVGADGTIHITAQDNTVDRLKYYYKPLVGLCAPWCEEETGTNSLGTHTSQNHLTLDSRGRPVVVNYLSDVSGPSGPGLAIAIRVGSAALGNCGTGSVWHCRVVETAFTPIGLNPSIAATPGDVLNIVYLSNAGAIRLTRTRDATSSSPFDREFAGTSTWANDVAVADVDNDGVIEMAVTGRKSAGYWDSAFFRVLSETVGFAVEGAMASNPTTSNMESLSIEVADPDRDGQPEMIMGGRQGVIDAWEARLWIASRERPGTQVSELTISWNNGTSTELESTSTADIDRDGVPEIVLGGHRIASPSAAVLGVVTFSETLPPVTEIGLEAWGDLGDPEGGADRVVFRDVTIDDLDLDGDQEIIAVGWKNKSDPSQAVLQAYSWDGTTLKDEGTGISPGGAFLTELMAVTAGDPDHDGEREVVVVGRFRMPIGNFRSYAAVVNYSNLNLAGTPEAVLMWGDSTGTDSEATDVAIADFDRDGHDEIVVTGFNTSGGMPTAIISLLEYTPGALTLAAPQSAFPFGTSRILGVQAADFDLDGIVEAVMVGEFHNGIDWLPMVIWHFWDVGSSTWAFDGGYQVPEFPGGRYNRVAVKDSNANGFPDLVAVGDRGPLSGARGLKEFFDLDVGVIARTESTINGLSTRGFDVALVDVDRDGDIDSVVGGILEDGTDLSNFVLYQPPDLPLDDTVSTLRAIWANGTAAISYVYGVAVCDLDHDGTIEIVTVGYYEVSSGESYGGTGIWAPIPEQSAVWALGSAAVAAIVGFWAGRRPGRSRRAVSGGTEQACG